MKSKLVLNQAKLAEASLQHLTCNLLPSPIRIEMLEGREHLVVPMVMLTEGVHHGSSGPIFYTAEEISKATETWNHRPVVVYHPEVNGKGVSACDPAIVNSRKVGTIFNTKADKGRLKAEAWIDKSRVNNVDERILPAITKNEMMEVSTGLYLNIEESKGKWNEEDYDGIARNFRPDHLAILPDQIGACSIADGAGLLRNKQNEPGFGELKSILNKLGLGKLIGNEMSYGNIQTVLQSLIRKKFNFNAESGPWIWIADIYSNFFVYEKEAKLFRLGYSASETGVSLSEETPVEVRRVTEYRTVEGAFVGNLDQTDKTTKHMDKTKVVNEIIVANAGWSEANRAALLAMDEKQLTCIQNGVKPAPAAPPEAPAAPANVVHMPEQKTATTNVNQPAKEVSEDEYLATLPPRAREIYRNQVNADASEKTRLVSVITANKANKLTKENLEKLDVVTLKGIADSLQPAATVYNYAGMAPVSIPGAQVQPALEPPVINYAGAKK